MLSPGLELWAKSSLSHKVSRAAGCETRVMAGLLLGEGKSISVSEMQAGH